MLFLITQNIINDYPDLFTVKNLDIEGCIMIFIVAIGVTIRNVIKQRKEKDKKTINFY